MRLSIVLPCYNEELVLRETNRRLTVLADQWLADRLISDLEIIYVNDGSQDGTLEVIRGLVEADARIRGVSLSTNFGHQAAILAGMEHASGDVTVTLDCDLQDPPDVIGEMLAKVREGYDIVYGARRSRATDTPFKRWTAHAFYRLLRLLRVTVVYDHADFRMMTRPVAEAFRQFPEKSLFLRGLFPLMGFKHCVVRYDRPARFAGETKYPLHKMIAHALNGITSFTHRPLRLALWGGILLFMFSCVLTAWAVASKLAGDTERGWTSIVVPLYFFSGLQMVFIGILGEYVGKIYHEVKSRPRYIVSEYLNAEPRSRGTARPTLPDDPTPTGS